MVTRAFVHRDRTGADATGGGDGSWTWRDD